MNTASQWRKALKQSPDDKTLLLAYADWLEENGDQLAACRARQKAGVGNLVYKLWHPSWGEERHGPWEMLSHLKSHVRGRLSMNEGPGYSRYRGDHFVPESELIVIVEWHATPLDVTRASFSPGLKL